MTIFLRQIDIFNSKFLDLNSKIWWAYVCKICSLIFEYLSHKLKFELLNDKFLKLFTLFKIKDTKKWSI